MKAHPEPGLNVEIGGCVVRLVCHDPALERRIQSEFPGPSRHQKPAVTLEVHIPSGEANKDIRLADPKSSSSEFLDGEGEYVAVFDAAARRAVIRLTGLDAILALANFIRRLFARLVIDNNGAVFHSACVVRKRPGCAGAGGAYVFFGKSGAGKSTVCELSRGCAIAGDDLTVVRVMGGRLRAWGLPALRSPPYRLSQGAFPIRAAFTLVQDSGNFVKRLEATAAIAGMLAFSSDLSDPEPVVKIIDLLTRLVHTVPCYELHFSKDPEFWNAIDAEVK